ncbi:EF-hand domain pair [Phytophthora cinnamomi]|uniref:EF-hand domain pair n=1 Tax=Phytophthora cinnamomi TaxID=4785 RepID=UPI00355A94CB|nr:EF-hand domain pair [Phytophthora cinnamomi]
MESLDASYALLSDVSARNRALQARLRGSLPLLWTDNALVMTSAAPRRRRGRLQPEQSAVAGEADQMLLALEEQAGLQVSRRYKRRVEWEVARRIARVDRELQQYPPAQRFWNQKRKKETPAQPRLYRQRLNGVERAQDDANARDSLTLGRIWRAHANDENSRGFSPSTPRSVNFLLS